MNPFFSIIIPTYNRAPTLSRAINSVLHQSFQDHEIIVVDDGSTDNTGEILQSNFIEYHITYYKIENGGVTAARNYGVSKAKGKFLVFLDSDDMLSPQYLGGCFEALSGSHFKLLLCAINYCDALGMSTKMILPEPLDDYYTHPLTGSYCIDAHLYREMGGYDNRLTYSENSDLFLRLFKSEWLTRNEIVILNTISVCIPVEDTKIRNIRHSKKRYENATYFLNKHAGHFSNSLKDYRNFKKIQALSALQQGMIKEARSCIGELLLRDPFSLKTILLYLFVLLSPGLARNYYS